MIYRGCSSALLVRRDKTALQIVFRSLVRFQSPPPDNLGEHMAYDRVSRETSRTSTTSTTYLVCENSRLVMAY